MEKWIGETENLIKASEIGMASGIKRQRKELEYRIELEQHLIDIYNDYTKEEVEKHCSTAVVMAWEVGQKLEMRPTPAEINKSL